MSSLEALAPKVLRTGALALHAPLLPRPALSGCGEATRKGQCTPAPVASSSVSTKPEKQQTSNNDKTLEGRAGS